MKKILNIIFACMVIIGISACSPKQPVKPVIEKNPPATTQPPVTNEPVADLEQACADANGKWLSEYQECEGASQEWCQTNGGHFEECGSACRHQPGAEMCTMQCVPVCTIGKTEEAPTPTAETNQPSENQPLLGGDRDEHGCIGSAGYQWCESKQKCLRIWEEAC